MSKANNERWQCGCTVEQSTLGSTRYNRLALCPVHLNGPELLKQLSALVVQIKAAGWLIVPPNVEAVLKVVQRG